MILFININKRLMEDEDELIMYNYEINNKYMHNLANKYFKEKDYEWALLLYNKLLENLIDDKIKSLIYSNKSACYLILKDFVNSLDNALQSIIHNNINSKAWGRVAWSFKGLNKNEDALKAFKIANKIDPYNINYKKEIYFYNSKKIDNINLFDLIKSSEFIMNKLKNKNFRNKILLNKDNLIQNLEFLTLMDHIINKIE